jgi:hypothetical protein
VRGPVPGPGSGKKLFAVIVVILAVWGIRAIIYSGNVGAAARMNIYKRISALPDSYMEDVERARRQDRPKWTG